MPRPPWERERRGSSPCFPTAFKLMGMSARLKTGRTRFDSSDGRADLCSSVDRAPRYERGSPGSSPGRGTAEPAGSARPHMPKWLRYLASTQKYRVRFPGAARSEGHAALVQWEDSGLLPRIWRFDSSGRHGAGPVLAMLDGLTEGRVALNHESAGSNPAPAAGLSLMGKAPSPVAQSGEGTRMISGRSLVRIQPGGRPETAHGRFQGDDR